MITIDHGKVVEHATELHEDAIVCHYGINRLMLVLLSMSRAYWGRLPWSDRWDQAWRRLVTWRWQDSGQASQLLQRTSNSLCQAVADYTHQDVVIATSFDVGDEAEDPNHPVHRLRAYLGDRARDYHLPPFRPGGDYAFEFPMGPEVPRSPAAGIDETGLNNPEPDDLDRILASDGWKIRDAENLLQRIHFNRQPHPYADYLEPVSELRAEPIERYAAEIRVAEAGYDEMFTELGKGLERLTLEWTGYAAGLYQMHGAELQRFLQGCRDEANWLRRTAGEVPAAIRTLRTEYADVVRDRAADISGALDGVFAELGSLRGLAALVGITDAATLAKLVFTLQALNAELAAKLSKAENATATFIATDAGRTDPKADAGDGLRGSGPVPFHRDEISGAAAWRDGSTWGQE